VDSSINFIGRLAGELLRLTDPRSSVYIEQVRACDVVLGVALGST
jgi:hypothetical protein